MISSIKGLFAAFSLSFPLFLPFPLPPSINAVAETDPCVFLLVDLAIPLTANSAALLGCGGSSADAAAALARRGVGIRTVRGWSFPLAAMLGVPMLRERVSPV